MAGPAALRTAGPRFDEGPQPPQPVSRQDRRQRWLRRRIVTEHVRGGGGDRPRRSVRQRHDQPELAFDPAEATGVERPVEERVRWPDHPNRARENPAQIPQCVPCLEYLWKAAWSFHAEGDPAAEEWVQEKALQVLRGKATIVAAAIRRKATAFGLDAPARKNADTCADYLLAKAPYLDYPNALAKGWPIATGVIEGACRHLVKDRMDITGARWGTEGAEAILKLRAVRSNGDFEDDWSYHLDREHQRLHRSRYAGEVLPSVA